jgi:hypothetical protein
MIADVNEIALSIDQDQYQDLLLIVDYIAMSQRREKLRILHVPFVFDIYSLGI